MGGSDSNLGENYNITDEEAAQRNLALLKKIQTLGNSLGNQKKSLNISH